MMSIYTDNGYRSRAEYLTSLEDEYGAPRDVILSLADLLGPEEDFDGLVVALQDYDQT